MSTLHIVRRCYNCGKILQDRDEKLEGYITPSILRTHNAVVLFCNECYEKEKYNVSVPGPTLSESGKVILRDASASDALIVCIVDLFSFEAFFPEDAQKLVSHNDLLIIGNKRDLLPKEEDDEDIREYVAHRFRAQSLDVTKDDVILASFSSLSDTRIINEEIEKRRRRRDVYVVGAEGCGKSLFMSSFLRHYENKTRRAVQTKPYPGTVYSIMEVPLDSSASLYNIPSTSNENTILAHLDFRTANLVMPKEAVKARSYSLSKGDTLALGGLASIELVSGEKTEVKVYLSKEVKTAKFHVQDGEAYFAHLVEKNEVYPSYKGKEDYSVYDIEVSETDRRDIGIAGLGWISFAGAKQVFRVYLPKGVSLYSSRAKLKK